MTLASPYTASIQLPSSAGARLILSTHFIYCNLSACRQRPHAVNRPPAVWCPFAGSSLAAGGWSKERSVRTTSCYAGGSRFQMTSLPPPHCHPRYGRRPRRAEMLRHRRLHGVAERWHGSFLIRAYVTMPKRPELPGCFLAAIGGD